MPARPSSVLRRILPVSLVRQRVLGGIDLDFLGDRLDGQPIVTAQGHLDLLLGRLGLRPESISLPSTALVALTPHCLRAVRQSLSLDRSERISVGGAAVFRVPDPAARFFVVGPAVGAPATAIVLENLAALGVRQVVAVGWCGSLAEEIPIGRFVLPREAIREEGTSFHYSPADVVARPDGAVVNSLAAACAAAGHAITQGTVWTTDAIYRETAPKIAAFRASGVVAVDMETSALFVVGGHLGLSVAALLVVSDQVGGAQWRAAFFDASFLAAHEACCATAIAACQLI